jgi:hypothetical protein
VGPPESKARHVIIVEGNAFLEDVRYKKKKRGVEKSGHRECCTSVLALQQCKSGMALKHRGLSLRLLSGLFCVSLGVSTALAE